MYLHLGKDTVVDLNEIIAIIDIKTIKNSRVTNEFINKAYKEGQIRSSNTKKVSSYVVTKNEVYLSSISAITLQNRANLSSAYR